jgi:hypothetical protein
VDQFGPFDTVSESRTVRADLEIEPGSIHAIHSVEWDYTLAESERQEKQKANWAKTMEQSGSRES